MSEQPDFGSFTVDELNEPASFRPLESGEIIDGPTVQLQGPLHAIKGLDAGEPPTALPVACVLRWEQEVDEPVRIDYGLPTFWQFVTRKQPPPRVVRHLVWKPCELHVQLTAAQLSFFRDNRNLVELLISGGANIRNTKFGPTTETGK